MFSQDWIKGELNKLSDYTAIEIGTRRWRKEPTHHRLWFPGAEKYIMTDFMAGPDVDVQADAHELSRVFGEGFADLIFAPSVFEHLEKPWIVAEEILKTLKPGGLFWVQTHHTYQLHGYPKDYFRYTADGLKVLFEKASEKYTDYEFPAHIISKQCGQQSRAFLNVVITGRR
jgi:SAM-dependent methyltransferase